VVVAPSMGTLADDLAAETAVLRALLDDVAVRAATEREAFATEPADVVAEGGADPDQIAARHHARVGATVPVVIGARGAGCPQLAAVIHRSAADPRRGAPVPAAGQPRS
jgi:hypothetical protein